MKLTRFRSGTRPSVRGLSAPVAAVAALSLLAACGSTAAENRSGGGGGDDSPYQVGVVTSMTGPLAEVGNHWLNGFEAGLDYLTDGTMEIDGRKIELIKGDDTGDAAVGTTVATDAISKGAKILAGPATSTVGVPVADLAVQNDVLFIAGGMGSTDLVGMDKRVFLTNGNSPAGTMVYKTIVGDASGKSIVSINQDYAFGQTQAASMKTLFEPLGAKVDSVLLPVDTVDFSAAAANIKKRDADFVQTTWIGPGQEQLYTALASQQALTDSTFFTTLFESATWPGIVKALGSDLASSKFAIMYYPGLTDNEKDQALQTYTEDAGGEVEFSDGIGWSSAEMLVQALSEGDYDNTESMAEALQGYSWEGPQGEVEIRAEDNQVIVPYFIVSLEKQSDGSAGLKLDQAVPASELVPEVVRELP